jgi:hypothetical protein
VTRLPRRSVLVALAFVVLPARIAVPQATPAVASGSSVAIPRLALDDDLAENSLVRVLDAIGTPPFPIAVRLEAKAGDPLSALDARLSALGRRKIPVWLSLPVPESAEAVATWRTALGALFERRGSELALVELAVDLQPPDLVRFAVQTAATELRSSGSAARAAIGGDAMADPSRRTSIYTADLAPYLDVLAVPADGGGTPRAEGLESWLHNVDPQAGLALRSSPGRVSGTNAIADRTLEDLGSNVVIRGWRSEDLSAARVRALAPLAALLAHDVTVLDDEAAGIAMARGGIPATGEIRHRLLFDTDTFSTYLAYWAERSEEMLSVSLTLAIEGTPVAHDLVTGGRVAVSDYSRDATTGRVRVRVPQTGRPMLLDFNEGAVAITERSGVIAERRLNVGEIIARHQQQQRTQDAAIRNYVARARMEQHFRPTVADPGYDIVAENTYFSSADGVEWEELSFSVNGSKWGADRPPFPLIQPEKVLSLPLQLKFDEEYRYRLAGTDRVDGFDCYVVKFEPVRDDNALYRGTVWIDRRTFARIKVHAAQSGLATPVVSNDEIQRFTPVSHAGTFPIFLFTELIARQIVLVAGRNLLVEKRVAFSDFSLNDPEFEQKRASARESNRVMFRETAEGLRYFVKEGGGRRVSDRPTLDVKALAMGVTLDPSYAFPLPIFGINYIDFQFRRPDTQLAILFAGVLAAGNLQRSNFGAKNLDASIDFFAIAVPSTDRLFGAGGEDETTRVLTWPLSTGINLGWQVTPFQKATFQYQFRFDGFVKDRTTSDAFTTPSSTVSNGIGGAWEYRRGGYSFVSNVVWFARAAWRPWGDGERTSPTYVRYSASLSRDFYLDAFQKLHFNGAWFGGRDLDRFNKYMFGMFDDTRIHGVPGGGVRFGELGMARGSYSINIFEQYRVDVFLEHAWGRDEPGRGGWEWLPGVGMALNVRAPWNTILRADFGKSVLPDRYGDLGSMTLQVMLLKPLR